MSCSAPHTLSLFQRGSDELFSACVTNGPFIMSSSSASAGKPCVQPLFLPEGSSRTVMRALVLCCVG